MIKRVFDITISSLMLLCLLPLFLLIAVAIKLESGEPVFFRQQRVGRYGKRFWILKFRTMQHNAEGKLGQLTVGADPRITRIGSLLRRYKLDELPQLLNVVLGDMSIVGPRPEVPYFVEFYPSGTTELIHSVRPGMTDYASIEFRSESDLLATCPDPLRTYIEEIIPAKVSFYLAYVREHTFVGDLYIIWVTCLAVFFGLSRTAKSTETNVPGVASRECSSSVHQAA